MDIELKESIKQAREYLKEVGIDMPKVEDMDPVAQMMLVALLNETGKVKKELEGITEKLEEHYSTDFIPQEKIGAMPAITLARTRCKEVRGGNAVKIGKGSVFAWKGKERKTTLNYIPLFKTITLPLYRYPDRRECVFQLTHDLLKEDGLQVDLNVENMDRPGSLYLGLGCKVEMECLKGLTLLIQGTGGVAPERIVVEKNGEELDFATAREMEKMDFSPPFDVQQASGQMFSFMDVWKENMLNMEDAVWVVITDGETDRDKFKTMKYPPCFGNWLYDNDFNRFNVHDSGSIWLRLDFPHHFAVKNDVRVIPNVVPLVNVEERKVTLSRVMPMAKLNKQEDSFFLRVLNTSLEGLNRGFEDMSKEVLVRDFDAICYNGGQLYRDARNLYNRFVDDYYAFIEFNEVKNGKALEKLRNSINEIGKAGAEKSKDNVEGKFDSGTYVMKKEIENDSVVSVSYIITMGEAGNLPKEGDLLDVRTPGLEQKAVVMVDAKGGKDKVSADERYELMRYYTLTNDRLYTRMDIDAFLRTEIKKKPLETDASRITIKVGVEGAEGPTHIRRGLYVDLDFKDKTTYEKAVAAGFDVLMQQRITNKACLSMPVFVKLKCQEQ